MTMTLTIFLFLCGLAGFILNRNNVILLIVAIELLLLASNIFNFLTQARPAQAYAFSLWITQATLATLATRPPCLASFSFVYL